MPAASTGPATSALASVPATVSIIAGARSHRPRQGDRSHVVRPSASGTPAGPTVRSRSPQTVSARFHYRQPGLYLLVVRIYRRHEPFVIPESPHFAGCRSWVELPETLPTVARSPDPRDDFLLALCEAGRADWLVTGDRNELLALGRHGQTHIVTAATFVEELRLAE